MNRIAIVNAALSTALVLGHVAPAGAQAYSPGQLHIGGRNVVINGSPMNPQQLALLDLAHCMQIPDGDYFLTEVTANVYVWGYAAFPGVPQGYLGEECQGQGEAQGSTGTGGGSFGSVPWYGSTEEGSMTYEGGISDGSGGFEFDY